MGWGCGLGLGGQTQLLYVVLIYIYIDIDGKSVMMKLGDTRGKGTSCSVVPSHRRVAANCAMSVVLGIFTQVV